MLECWSFRVKVDLYQLKALRFADLKEDFEGGCSKGLPA